MACNEKLYFFFKCIVQVKPKWDRIGKKKERQKHNKISIFIKGEIENKYIVFSISTTRISNIIN